MNVPPQPSSDHAYSQRRVLALWAAAALPMFLLAWGAAPALITRFDWPAATIYWLAVFTGMVWQCLLSLWIIRREEGNLRWATLQRRLWLKAPDHPEAEAVARPSLWRILPSLLLMAFCVALGALFSAGVMVMSLSWPLGLLWPPHAQALELASPEQGSHWWWVAAVMAAWALGAVLGEELFFRGILLPKMGAGFSRRVYRANALLYAAYSVYRPWMIPFRYLEGLAIARAVYRFRNNWLALVVRSVEGLGLLAVLVLCGLSFSLPKLEGPLTFPNIRGNPAPALWGGARGRLQRPPAFNPDSGAMWQVDLRSRDVSVLDLRSSRRDLLFADFDSRTHWPPPSQMPEGFDPRQILELNKSPGLGLRRLHAQGVTGRGVGIAILDHILQTTHREYAERLRWYEEFGGSGGQAHMHGAAVTSIAVGKTVGVAPEADLYYLAHPDNVQATAMRFHVLALGVRRVLEINRHLPPERRIRVISMSIGWTPESVGYDDIRAAAEEAKRAGLLVICSSVEAVHGFRFHGLGRPPLSDPDEFASYEPGLFWSRDFWESPGQPAGRLHIPMDSRTTASPTGENDYVFYREGGWSWAIPYIAGLYALAVQVDPQITPERFWSLAVSTGHHLRVERGGKTRTLGPIVNPEALIAAIRQGRSAALGAISNSESLAQEYPK